MNAFSYTLMLILDIPFLFFHFIVMVNSWENTRDHYTHNVMLCNILTWCYSCYQKSSYLCIPSILSVGCYSNDILIHYYCYHMIWSLILPCDVMWCDVICGKCRGDSDRDSNHHKIIFSWYQTHQIHSVLQSNSISIHPSIDCCIALHVFNGTLFKDVICSELYFFNKNTILPYSFVCTHFSLK